MGKVLSSIPWNLGSVCLEFEAEVLEKVVVYHMLQYESFPLSCDNIDINFKKKKNKSAFLNMIIFFFCQCWCWC
jgi:hypothetical protein